MKLFSLRTTLPLLLTALPLVQGACQKYLDAANQAAGVLQQSYPYPNPGQWVWISAVDAYYLRQLDEITGATTYSHVIDTVFNGWENWLDTGKSYDDVQWVSIAYLQAGRVDLARKYYDIASEAWSDDYCGGGLFWSGARDYKNAITNELYLTTSGYMFDVTLDTRYLDNLKRTWAWYKNTPMRGSNGLYNDGLTKDGSCGNNGQVQWTYNQGTLLPGLAYLYKHTQDEEAIQTAWSILDSVIEHSTTNGGLREVCETATDLRCNADQQTFKGILVSYVGWFLAVSGRDQGTKYSDWLKLQGDKILENASGDPGRFSNLWYERGPAAAFTLGAQAAALGGLVAAARQHC